jgi:hypothetical protein
MAIDIRNSYNVIDASTLSLTILAIFASFCSVLIIWKGKGTFRVSLIVSFVFMHLLAKIYFLFRGALIV